MTDLTGQYVLITGGSRGIGAVIAQHLARQGARVGITYLSNKEPAGQVLKSLPGAGHLMIAMDVQDPASVQKGMDEFMQHFGYLTSLINNAGIARDNLLMRMSDEEFDTVLRTNLYGGFYCARAAVKHILKTIKKLRNTPCGIVNISSVVAQLGNPGQANYSASKSALEGLTRSLARELAARHICVNAVAPGFIKTDMTSRLTDSQIQQIKEHIPLKTLGEPEDVAQTVAFLLKATYITGQVIAVNGGLAM